jgi:DNA-binding transcriptional MerR regulator
MKIGELARLSGLTAHTLRYYERIGLLPRAGRDGSGQRDYDASALVWIDFLRRLKTTGMPLREMLRYARLRAQGPGTGPLRRDLLIAHRAGVQAHIAELQACLAILDSKIDGYAAARERSEDHDDAKGSRNPTATRPAGAGGN